MLGNHYGWRRHRAASYFDGPTHTQSVSVSQVATAVAIGGGDAIAYNTVTIIVMCG
jgi:hypothetical protein